MHASLRVATVCCVLELCFLSAYAAEPTVEVSNFGKLANGEVVKLFTLNNGLGMQVKVIEYGATIIQLNVPDRDNLVTSVLLGADSLAAYLNGFPAASVMGRFANRIRNAKFTLDGKEYEVTKNSGPHHIHGGQKNFAKVLWSGSSESKADVASVTLKYESADGEEGFPGTLAVAVTYSISSSNELSIAYEAKTSKPTVVNLTNHAYFNLTGTGDVLGHELQLMSNTTTMIDDSRIPTGGIALVAGTPLDFIAPHAIGERIAKLNDTTRGYDHNYIVSGSPGELRMAARVFDPKSGRVMECLTTEPAVQLFTANSFNGKPFPKHGAFCLETQHYPDSPNHPEFPSTVVRPEKDWSSQTIYRFSVQK